MPAPAVPPHVATGQPVAATWGNQVVDTIEWTSPWLRIGDSTTRTGRMMIVGDARIITTDGNGRFGVAYTAPLPFVSPNPVVWCSLYMDTFPGVITIYSVDLIGFSARVWNGAAPFVNSSISIQWLATGYAAV